MNDRKLILRVVVLALLLYAFCCLTREYRILQRTEALVESLTADRERLAAEQQILREKLEQQPDPEEMRRLAWERLGMVMPGERVFYFEAREDKQQSTDKEGSLWNWKLEALWKDG